MKILKGVTLCFSANVMVNMLLCSAGLNRQTCLSIFLFATFTTLVIVRCNWTSIVLKLFEYQIKTCGLDPSEKAIYSDLISIFDAIARKNNISYFLYGGSLLGYIRIGDILPWDDDIDLLIDEMDYEKIRQDINNLTNYKATPCGEGMLKIFSNINFTVKFAETLSFPYLDIFLTRKSGDHYLHVIPTPAERFLLTDVYPAQDAMFMGRRVMVPSNARQIMEDVYGKDVSRICQGSKYSHRRGKEMWLLGLIRIECDKLWKHINLLEERSWIP